MKALLVATVRAGIEAEFGFDAYPAVADRLEQLVDRLAAQTIEGHVAVLDDPVQMARCRTRRREFPVVGGNRPSRSGVRAAARLRRGAAGGGTPRSSRG